METTTHSTMPVSLRITKNALPTATRLAGSELCNTLLVDAIDLMLLAKHSHWNVSGPSFAALHELFDRVFQGALEHVDLLGERVVQLGGRAGSARPTAEASIAGTWREHVDALSSALARFGARASAAIVRAEKLGDRVTADLLTQVARQTDERLWLVEAHLADERAP